MVEKKQPETALVPTVVGPEALERPDWLPKGDVRGTEHLTNEDIQMPRMGLAQQMSPELNESEPAYIEGLKIGSMFNSLTQQVYGKGPMDFTVIRADPPHYIEFHPREKGGGIKDYNVAPTDPRTQFGPSGEPPIATKFYDFVILLLPSMEPIALSCKSSNLKMARQLNALMKLRNAPSFYGKYTLTSLMTKNAKGAFSIFHVQNAGNVTREVFQFASQMFDGLKHRTIVIDREPGDETLEAGPTSFDTTNM